MDRQVRNDKTAHDRGVTPVVPGRRRPVVTIVLLFFALALVLDGIAGERGLIANRRDRRQLEQVEQELAAKRLENAELRDLAHRLQAQDPATIEEYARKELGLMRPGEKLFIVHDVTEPSR